MPFSNDILIRVIIFILGVCGFMVAKNIRNHKIKSTPLVCPIGFDCNAVVHSNYSRFFGMPVEFLGMIYYALISFIYLFVIFRETLSPYLVSFLILTSLLGLIFSIYLILVQIFILKKGCSWCFVSAFISIVIFSLTMFIYDFNSITQILIK